MVLFFVLSMVAAYTSRNLIFEQRTSANQYRSTQAFEAAEAGLQWAQAQLNGGFIDDDCRPDSTGPSFRERYLSIAPDSGVITVPLPGGVSLQPTCVFDGTTWTCKCPRDSASSPAAPSSGTGPYPAFRVRFTAVVPPTGTPPPPGLVTIEVNGCTRLDEGCIAFPAAGTTAQPAAGDALARVTALLGLKSGLAAPPMATLTALGDVNLAARVVNSDPASTGITVHAGGGDPASATQVETIAGSPPELSKSLSDAALAALDPTLEHRPTMFTATFALKPSDYQQQPAAIDMSSVCPTSCSAAQVATRAGTNPGRMFWIPGDLVVDADLGSLTTPLLLVVGGDVTFSSGATLHGLLYVQNPTWTSSGLGTVRGAVVAEGDIVGTDTPTFIYDSSVLTRLRRTHGSFVLVPGSWKDYR
jgi:hypothetical protein